MTTPKTELDETERPDRATLRFYVKFTDERLSMASGPIDAEALASRAVADLVEDGLMPTVDDIAEVRRLAAETTGRLAGDAGRAEAA